MKSKILIATFLFVFLFTIDLDASENYNSYSLSSTKKNGLKYEIVDTRFNDSKLQMSGWAYIDNAQHYKKSSDVITTIRVAGNDGSNEYFKASITNKYNMTDIEYYTGANKEWCASDELNMNADKCNYKYDYVSFNVSIPLTVFNPGVDYDFYIYVNPKHNSKKQYVKMYMSNLDITKKIDGVTYHLTSELDLSNLVVNDEHVIVRSGPSKNSSEFKDSKGRTYFYTKKKKYDYVSDKKDGYVTWYKIKFNTTNKKELYRYLATTGSSYKGYISSPYVDFSGSGNLKLRVTSNQNIKIDEVFAETMREDFMHVGMKIKFENFDKDVSIGACVYYNYFNECKTVKSVDGYSFIDMMIPTKYYKKGSNIKFYLDFKGYNIYDNIESDNSYLLSPYYVSKNKQTISKPTVIKTESAKSCSQTSCKTYYESVNINYDNTIDTSGKDGQYNKYYSGGAFDDEISISYSNDFKQAKKYPDNASGYIDVLDILDYEKSQIKLEYINNKFVAPYSKIDENGVVKHADASSGERKFYTKLGLDKRDYNQVFHLENIGINQLQLDLNFIIKISGDILGNNKDALYYYRYVSKINPMPKYSSSMWKDNISQITNNKKLYKKISITSSAIKSIQSKIDENFSVNYRDKNLIKNGYDNLVKKQLIKEG